MCGFAGILNIAPGAGGSPDPALLSAMADTILHRGPDATDTYVDNGYGVAHRRLSILDLENGAQPMASQDGQVVVAFNGEIFNFIELRAELEKAGQVFRTRSDTEVLLELYRARGLAFVNELNGQFAIAIWDRRDGTLHLVRDRIGICPLYYTIDGGRLVFGSEIKSLVPALTRKPRLSAQGLDQVFTFWAPVSPNTVFEDIYEVSPGQTITVANGKLKKQRYWEWPLPEQGYARQSEAELANELHDILVDATQVRLRSDVPVGAYLSGGLDSSTIVSLILNHTESDLRTFSLTFADRAFDESSYQASLVSHAKVKHSELSVDNAAIGAALCKAIRHGEQPVLRTAPAAMGMLSAHVRESGYKVVLTGEGADEVLGGYDIFKEAKVRQFWARQPDSQVRPLLLKKLYPYLTLPKGKGAEYLKRFFGEELEHPERLVFSHLPRWSTTSKAKRFFSADLRARISSDAIADFEKSLPGALHKVDAFNRAQYIESKTLMSGYLLCSQGDRMLMMNSVEGRFPFLDHRLMEFAARIPPRLKMKALNEKNLLKKAVEGYLPDTIVKRHKQPYRAPDIAGIGTGEVSEEIAEAIAPPALEDAGLFDPAAVGLLRKKAAARGSLSVSESQSMTGIITTQLVHKYFC